MKMDGQVVVTAACALFICVVLQRRRRIRRIWTREWTLNRATQGAFHQSLQGMCVCVSSYFPPDITVRKFLDLTSYRHGFASYIESDMLVDFFLASPKRARCHYAFDRARTHVTSR